MDQIHSPETIEQPTRSRYGRTGLSLIELMIVMAVIAALAAIIVPNVSGFLSRGKQNAYDSDHQLLQVAIDSWRTDIGLRSTTPWPILEGGDECIGTVNPRAR